MQPGELKPWSYGTPGEPNPGPSAVLGNRDHVLVQSWEPEFRAECEPGKHPLGSQRDPGEPATASPRIPGSQSIYPKS